MNFKNRIVGAGVEDPNNIHGNPFNWRKHPDMQQKAMTDVLENIGWVQDVIINQSTGNLVDGHLRVEMAIKNGEKSIPVKYVELTEDEEKTILATFDPISFMAETDRETLQELIENTKTDVDLSAFQSEENKINFDELDKYKIDKEEHVGNLKKNYIVPPFSVLDTRSADWQNRKKDWLSITGNLSESRDGEFGRLSGSGKENMMDVINGGTSNFDPVLAEVMYKWFNVDGGHILDCFGGEQTKGVVAGELGYKYTAVEFRQEQVDVNIDKTKQYENVRYFCGDSNNISSIVKERNFDMCFTSPPYYDLEVYSKDDMSALGTYDEFMSAYKNIFKQCYDMLADDSFLVVKVGEIRDKQTGIYRSFVPDNVKVMTDIGFKYYNEIILLNSVGTAPFRANNAMRGRKVVKIHQNVLVFFKGNQKHIPDKFPQLYFEEDE